MLTLIKVKLQKDGVSGILLFKLIPPSFLDHLLSKTRLFGSISFITFSCFSESKTEFF